MISKEISIIGSLSQALHCTPWDFAKIKQEDGDAGGDMMKIVKQSQLPLDNDESHFTTVMIAGKDM